MSIIVAWLIADFLSGVGHFIQDKFINGPYDVDLLNLINEDNINHHNNPSSIARYTLWENAKVNLMLAWPISFVLLLLGLHTLSLAFFFLGFANIIHRYAHAPDIQVPVAVKFLQEIGIFISREQHNKHHYDKDGIIPKHRTIDNYCVMTTALNPILDRIGFFQTIERVFHGNQRR